MKKLLFPLLVLISFNAIAQTAKFELTEANPKLINQYVVLEKDSMTIADGYNMVLEWINITYNTPKEVIKAQLANDYIRIEGVNKNITSKKALGMVFNYLGRYSITFEFKENKIKMELTKIECYEEPSRYVKGGWFSVYPVYETKKKNERFYQGIVTSMNDLSTSLYNYLISEKKSVINKNDW